MILKVTKPPTKHSFVGVGVGIGVLLIVGVGVGVYVIPPAVKSKTLQTLDAVGVGVGVIVGVIDGVGVGETGTSQLKYASKSIIPQDSKVVVVGETTQYPLKKKVSHKLGQGLSKLQLGGPNKSQEPPKLVETHHLFSDEEKYIT
jgi:hypothetical protein